MDVTCLALEPGGRLRPEAEATAVAAWRAGAGPWWIHLGGGSPDEVATWLAALGLDQGLLDLLLADPGETRIIPLAAAVFVAYPVPAGVEGMPPDHFACLCLDRLVITMFERVPEVPRLATTSIQDLVIPEASTAGVVCALALVHASRLRRQVVALRRRGDALAGRMDSDPEAVPLEGILALKRQALVMGGLVDEELAVLEILKASRREVLPLQQLADTFQIAIEITRATDRDTDRLELRLGDLQRRHESILQDRTNRRLAQLTVLSAVFMPLTLIAGIYGMNFEFMPELHFRWGYPAALLGMALIAGGILWYLRARWKAK